MSNIVPFRPRSRLRLVEPGANAVVVAFPRDVMRRRLDQLISEHIREILRVRLSRHDL